MKGIVVFITKNDETFYLAREQAVGSNIFCLTKDFLRCFLFNNYEFAKDAINKLSKTDYTFKNGYVYKTAFVDCTIEFLDTYIDAQIGMNGETHLVTQ